MNNQSFESAEMIQNTMEEWQEDHFNVSGYRTESVVILADRRHNGILGPG